MPPVVFAHLWASPARSVKRPDDSVRSEATTPVRRFVDKRRHLAGRGGCRETANGAAECGAI